MENELLFETFAYGIGYGIAIFWWTGILLSIFNLVYEIALEKRSRRNKLKFLDNEDIELMLNHLDENIPCACCVSEVIINAYQKDKQLKEFRKEKRKKFWNKLKFWKKKDKETD